MANTTCETERRSHRWSPPSRKRSLALIGLSCLLVPLEGQQRHQSQHWIHPPKRKVQYSNAQGNSESERIIFSKFRVPSAIDQLRSQWESSSSDAECTSYSRKPNVDVTAITSLRHPDNEIIKDDFLSTNLEIGGRKNSRVNATDDGDIYSHLHVDAARECVDEVFNEVRRKHRVALGIAQRPRPYAEDKTPSAWKHIRRLFSLERSTTGSKVDQPKEGSTRNNRYSSVVRSSLTSPQSSISGFVNVEDASGEGEQEDFNVTTGIEIINDNGNESSLVDKNRSNSTLDWNRQGDGTTTVIYTQSEQGNHTANNSLFQPIRIRAYLSELDGAGQFLDDDQHSFLFQNISRPALLSWSEALRVRPVVGNLTVDPNQLIDGATCGPGRDSGLPSAVVPKEHMTLGVPHTDLILYLSIAFVSSRTDSVFKNASLRGNEDLNSWNVTGNSRNSSLQEHEYDGKMTSSNETRSDFSSSPTAAQYRNSSWLQGTQPRNSSSSRNETMERPSCSGEYLAAAAICSTDQYDRPTAAILHICIGEDFFNASSLFRNIMTMRHEIAHALGFNSLSLAHFRRTDGTPITPRKNNGEIPVTEVECTGPHNSRFVANVSLPSEEIMQFRTVRGGVRVAEVVTPSVVQVVRNHFDCHELPGAELESGESLPLSTDNIQISCLGDHWERRLFKSDLMNPLVDDLEFNARISTLDLAFFADSGWYQVDLSRAAPPAGWGRAAGCDFIEQTCIDDDGEVPATFRDTFCSDSEELDVEGYANEISGCTSDLTKKASCSIELYDGELPNEYQYFNGRYGSNVGGRDSLMDYCPVYTGFTNGLCSDSENEALIRVDRIERFGDRNSRCVSGIMSTNRTALCLRIACAVEDRSFHVQVDGVWRLCKNKDEVLETATGDLVICPDPIRICPTFYCQRDCLGSDRICNYTLGECVCSGNCTEDEDSGVIDDDHSSSSLPDEDSSLSDYYVPTLGVLQDEMHILEAWQIVSLAVACVIVSLSMLHLLYRKYRSVSEVLVTTDSGDGGDHDLGATEAALAVADAMDPNKDKMMATVVVALRMNNNTSTLRDDALQDRSSETDMSMTDTDGGGTDATDLSIDYHHDDGLFGLVDNACSNYVDPLAQPCVVRRRNQFQERR